ncbi:MAG: putative Fe-S cluster assembly protein SufT [Burkholderiaceae bacterium]|nr:putative Fe-S cluster assembly protein SufT [Burkholderiaceae bacterium]MEB2353015.1 putative Fe-S cluster assembly protein SufT [Burkholderiaceae bacterium]
MGYRHGDIQEVTLTRDCPAVAVPWGTATTLEAGRVGYISQQLGGTFTVMVDGNLYRIDGRHADALGLELNPSEELALGVGDGPPTTVEAVEKAAWAQLGTCYDPEIPIDIVNLGLVYGCDVKALDGGTFRIDVRMTLTAAGCGMGTLIADEARAKLLGIPNVADVDVELVWDPPWSREMMSESAQLEMGLL